MTWRELLGGEALRETIAEIDPPPPPLLSRLMAGIGAWIAGCFFLGAMLALLEFFNFSEWTVLILFGAACLVFAVALRWSRDGVVAEQLGIVLLSTGLVATTVGIEDLVESSRLSAGILAGIATALVFAYREGFARTWLTVVALGSVTIAADEIFRGEDAATFMGVVAMVIGVMAGLAARGEAFAALSRPVLRGSILALLFANLSLLLDGEATDPILGAAEALVLSAFGAWLSRDTRLRVGALGLPILVAAFGAPGVIAGALGVTVATWLGDRILLGLSAAYTVGFVGWYYDDMELDLWSKAGTLAATGALCLLARWGMHRAFATEER